MFSLSPFKILIVVAVAMLLLGPDKLPDVAHRLGATWRALKRLQERVENEVREVIPDLPSTSDIARIARSPVNLLNSLADRVDAKEADSTSPDVSTPEADAPPPTLRTPEPHRHAETAQRPDDVASGDPSLN